MLVEVGAIIEGKISGITNFGAFVQLAGGRTGLIHISEVAEEYVRDIRAHLKENQVVKVKVISVEQNGKVGLSIKKAVNSSAFVKSSRPVDVDWGRGSNDNMSFEERLVKFMKDSDEKSHDLKKNVESKRGSSGYKKSAQI